MGRARALCGSGKKRMPGPPPGGGVWGRGVEPGNAFTCLRFYSCFQLYAVPSREAVIMITFPV
jgi:hypothetical protein